LVFFSVFSFGAFFSFAGLRFFTNSSNVSVKDVFDDSKRAFAES
jgi:hypothetical protein